MQDYISCCVNWTIAVTERTREGNMADDRKSNQGGKKQGSSQQSGGQQGGGKQAVVSKATRETSKAAAGKANE